MLFCIVYYFVLYSKYKSKKIKKESFVREVVPSNQNKNNDYGCYLGEPWFIFLLSIGVDLILSVQDPLKPVQLWLSLNASAAN